MTWKITRILAAIALFFGLCVPLLANGDGSQLPVVRSAVMSEYRQRLEVVRKQIPQITRVAETVAKRWVKKKKVLIHMPFDNISNNFTMEFGWRSGGMNNMQSNTVRVEMRTPNDVFLFAPRSWEEAGKVLDTDGKLILKEELTEARKAGWMIIVFASKQGMPEGLPIDFLIDNGANGGGEGDAAMNQIVNMTNGWIWCCELTAALTRLGKHPSILKGMPVPGAAVHNKAYQMGDGDPKLYRCKTKIPAGTLANAYLKQVERELANLEGKAMQDQIARAADYAVVYLKEGKTVWATSNTHVLDGEVLVNNISPIKSFRGISGIASDEIGEMFDEGMGPDEHIKPGDLLFFFGEWTLNLPWRDVLKIIRRTGADFIPSYRLSTELTENYEGLSNFRDQNIDDALMLLEQHWPFDNAVVPLPFPPGKMAPISGIYVCLLYRMLDEKIAHGLDDGK